jgi:hypothetical protein
MRLLQLTALTVGLMTLATATPLSSASAQKAIRGALYPLHTFPSGTCPGLDWHFVVNEDNTVDGTVMWDRMRHVATFEGAVNPDRTFALQAKEVGGTRTATIKGNVTPEFVNLTISGTGTGCDNKTLKINIANSASGTFGGGG